MAYLIFIAGLAVGFVLRGLFSVQGREPLADLNAERKEAREKALEKAMKVFERKGEIANDDVERALNVSDATATNYLHELETRGKIIQIGAEGRGVTYKKK